MVVDGRVVDATGGALVVLAALGAAEGCDDPELQAATKSTTEIIGGTRRFHTLAVCDRPRRYVNKGKQRRTIRSTAALLQ
jgi:hypothetical protein